MAGLELLAATYPVDTTEGIGARKALAVMARRVLAMGTEALAEQAEGGPLEQA